MMFYRKKCSDRRRYTAAFTLAEMMMVAVIVGLLAALITPLFSNQRDHAAISTTKANLENVRLAISLYNAEEEQWPANNLGDLFDGTAPSGIRYIGAIPKDGIKSVNQVVNVIDNTGGWYWDSANHEISPNLTGNDANGKPYSEY